MKKKKMLVDFDEAIVYTTQGYLNYLNKHYQISKTMADVITYHNMAEDLKISSQLSEQTWREFYQKNITENCELAYGFKEIINWLHKEGFEVEILTSRPDFDSKNVRNYLHKRGFNFIQVINCVNTYQGGEKRSKGEVFLERNGNFFVEDTTHHILDVSNVSKESISFLKRKLWNQNDILKGLPSNVHPVDDWFGIGDYMQNLLLKK